jgi:hypothetical protein
MTNGNLERAVRKITRTDVSRQEWGGCLTPSEIAAILENGGMANSRWPVDYAKRKMAEGDSNPTWFYFTIRKNSALKQIVEKVHPSPKARRHK